MSETLKKANVIFMQNFSPSFPATFENVSSTLNPSNKIKLKFVDRYEY